MRTSLRLAAVAALALTLAGTAAIGQNYNQVNQVSSQPMSAPFTDSDLVNPWGMSRSSSSPWWVSDNATGLATLYNGLGVKQGLVVTIPAATSAQTGTPTGTVYNGSPTDFLLAPGEQAVFLFCTLDGTIAGWNPSVGVPSGGSAPSTSAVTVVKTTDGSVFTGMTSGIVDNHFYLYLANFSNGRVDVYDKSFRLFHFAGAPFVDDKLPANYVPFNVQAIGGDIVVTYALLEPGNKVETDGPGNGYVDIYTPWGVLLRRLEHGSWLNSPWGVALAPLDFGLYSHDLLVGQFAGGGTTQSSGYIAAYDLVTGQLAGLLQDASGNPLAINGVWDISPGNIGPNNSVETVPTPESVLYFTAGPKSSSQGAFGFVRAVSSELIQGNAQ